MSVQQEHYHVLVQRNGMPVGPHTCYRSRQSAEAHVMRVVAEYRNRGYKVEGNMDHGFDLIRSDGGEFILVVAIPHLHRPPCPDALD